MSKQSGYFVNVVTNMQFRVLEEHVEHFEKLSLAERRKNDDIVKDIIRSFFYSEFGNSINFINTGITVEKVD